MKKFATSLDTMHKAMKKWPTADLAVESDDDHDDDQSRMLHLTNCSRVH